MVIFWGDFMYRKNSASAVQENAVYTHISTVEQDLNIVTE